MKRLLTIIASLLLACSAAIAQDYRTPEVRISQDRVSVDGKLFYAHVVTEKQTLYSISKAYNVALSDIYEANKNLNLETEGLKSGQVLLIPITENVEEASSDNGSFLKELFPGLFKSDEVEEGPEKQDTLEFVLDIPDTIRVATVLPFTKSRHSYNSMDFYSGQLMAIRDFSIDSTKLEVRALNLNDSTSVLSDSLKTCDLIMGPISGKDVLRCLDSCPEGKIMVSPLDPYADSLVSTRYMINSPTPTEVQNREIIKWLKEDFEEGDKIVLLRSTRSTSPASQGLIDSLVASGLPYTEIPYSFLQGRSIQSSYSSNLSKKGTTRYVLASEDEPFMSDAVRNVSLMSYKKNKVALYANSKLRSYEAIEIEHVHKANSHICAAYFIDYSNDAVNHFVMTYRALFGAEPNSFAIHGYDSMHYFLNICKTYGKMWPMKLTEYKEKGLQTDFDFVQAPDGKGFINQAVRRVEYMPDYSVVLR